MIPFLPVLGKLAVKYLVPLLAQEAVKLGFKAGVWGWKKIKKKKRDEG